MLHGCRSAGVAVALALSLSGALALDLHDYWDRRCAECHSHSGEFARRFLSARDGKLIGRHHRENLQLFLRHHYLATDMIEPVTAMLLAQVGTEPRFRHQCGGCHESAAAFARKSLTMREGILIGRSSGRPVAEFLNSHARLKPADVPFFVDVLTRVTHEIEGR